MNWAKNSPPPQSKPTIAPPWVLWPTTYCPTAQKPWTCVSGGSVTAMSRIDSDTTGARALSTVATTSWNTTAPPTTPRDDRSSLPWPSSLMPYARLHQQAPSHIRQRYHAAATPCCNGSSLNLKHKLKSLKGCARYPKVPIGNMIQQLCWL